MGAVMYQGPPRRVSFGWINEAFQLFTRDGWTWVAATLIFGAIEFSISGVIQLLFLATGHPVMNYPSPTYPSPSPGSQFTPEYFVYAAVSNLVLLPVNGFLMGGIFRMANKSVRGQPLGIADLFSGGPTTLSVTLFSFIYAICSYVGIFACCVGMFVVVGLLYPAYALLADGEDLSTAISKSFEGMKNDWFTAGLFVIVYSLLYLASFVCCCLPVLATIPMAFIIGSLAYRDMIGMPLNPGDPPVVIAPAGSWPPPPSTYGSGQFNPPTDPDEQTRHLPPSE